MPPVVLVESKSPSCLTAWDVSRRSKSATDVIRFRPLAKESEQVRMCQLRQAFLSLSIQHSETFYNAVVASVRLRDVRSIDRSSVSTIFVCICIAGVSEVRGVYLMSRVCVRAVSDRIRRHLIPPALAVCARGEDESEGGRSRGDLFAQGPPSRRQADLRAGDLRAVDESATLGAMVHARLVLTRPRLVHSLISAKRISCGLRYKSEPKCGAWALANQICLRFPFDAQVGAVCVVYGSLYGFRTLQFALSVRVPQTRIATNIRFKSTKEQKFSHSQQQGHHERAHHAPNFCCCLSKITHRLNKATRRRACWCLATADDHHITR